MAARNCVRCNKVFEYLTGPPLCSDCKNQDEIDFKKVRNYLYDNPEATIVEISKELKISVKKLNRFIKEGRLELKKFKNISLECRSCGKPIESGEYCDKCKRELAQNFKDISSGGKEPTKRDTAEKSRHYDGFYSRRQED